MNIAAVTIGVQGLIQVPAFSFLGDVDPEVMLLDLTVILHLIF